MPEPSSAALDEPVSLNLRSNLTLWACSALHAVNDAFFAVIFPLLPLLAVDLNLSYAEVGLVKTAFSGASSAFQVPVGLLAERWGEYALLVGGNAWVAAGLIGMGLAGSYLPLLGLTVLGGLGGNTQHPLAASLVSRRAPPGRRATAVGTLNFAGDLGKMAGPPLVALVALPFGWRTALIALGVFGVLFSIVISRLPVGDSRSGAEPASPPAPDSEAPNPPAATLPASTPAPSHLPNPPAPFPRREGGVAPLPCEGRGVGGLGNPGRGVGGLGESVGGGWAEAQTVTGDPLGPRSPLGGARENGGWTAQSSFGGSPLSRFMRGWGIDHPGRFSLLSMLGTIDSSTRGAALAFLSFVLAEKGLDPAQVSWLFTIVFVGGAVGKFGCGRLGDRFGDTALIVSTELVTVACLALFPGAPVLLVPLLALGFGFVLNGTSSVLYAMVADFVPENRRSRGYGLYYTLINGSGAAAPVLYGLLGDQAGLVVLFGTMAAVNALTVPLAFALAHSRRLASPDQTASPIR